MDVISIQQHFKEINGPKVFGEKNLISFDESKAFARSWEPCYIYALHKAVVFYPNYAKLSEYIKKSFIHKEIELRQKMLEMSLPNFKNLYQS